MALAFTYAIKFPHGGYYTGADYEMVDGRHQYVDKALNHGPVHMAQTYTEARAHAKIAAAPEVFAGCVVKCVL